MSFLAEQKKTFAYIMRMSRLFAFDFVDNIKEVFGTKEYSRMTRRKNAAKRLLSHMAKRSKNQVQDMSILTKLAETFSCSRIRIYIY